MKKHYIVDGMVSGTGVRDGVEGGYIELSQLEIPQVLRNRISKWQNSYKNEFVAGFANPVSVRNLDREGVKIAQEIRNCIVEGIVQYYSDALMKEISIEQY